MLFTAAFTHLFCVAGSEYHEGHKSEHQIHNNRNRIVFRDSYNRENKEEVPKYQEGQYRFKTVLQDLL